MFTKNNTMNEILNTEPVGRAAGNLFPTCFMARVPVEHRDHTMAQIEKEETMEWGAPFLADAFLECANPVSYTHLVRSRWWADTELRARLARFWRI